MPFKASFNFVKGHFSAGLSVSKPALDLLAERLDEAARLNEGGGSLGIPKSKGRVSLPALIERHGRLEMAVMCMLVENVASAFLIHDHGVRGAIDRTLPLLGTRALSTFDTAFDFFLAQAHTVVHAAAKSIDNRTPPSFNAPARVLLSRADHKLRASLGKDYVVDTRVYIGSIPRRASAFVKVKIVKAMAIQDRSRLASLLVSGIVHTSALSVFGAASFFAFVHIFTIRVEKGNMEDTNDLSLSCDLSTVTTATSTTANDADISGNNTFDFLVEDVETEDEDQDRVGGAVESGVEGLTEVNEEDEDQEDDIMLGGVEEGIEQVEVEEDVVEVLVVDVIEGVACLMEDDGEVAIIPPWLIGEDVVVEEFADEDVAALEEYEEDFEEYDYDDDYDDLDFEPELSVIEEEDEEDEEQYIEATHIKAMPSVAEWLDGVEDIEAGLSEDTASEDDRIGELGAEKEVSHQVAPEVFDEELRLELAIIEKYLGGDKEDEDDMGLVGVAILCGLDEEEEEWSGDKLLELAIMEHYQQEAAVAEEEEQFVEEVDRVEHVVVHKEDFEEEDKKVLVELFDEERLVLVAEVPVEAVENTAVEVEDAVEDVTEVHEQNELVEEACKKFLEMVEGHEEILGVMEVNDFGVIKEDLVEAQEDMIRFYKLGPVHELPRCASMPCLSPWGFVVEERTLRPCVSFEFRGRKTRFGTVNDMLDEEQIPWLEAHQDLSILEEGTMEAQARPESSSAAVDLVQETEKEGVEEKENMGPILLSGPLVSKSTLTPSATPFVPRGNFALWGTPLTSISQEPDKENTFALQMPPPAHWMPAKGLSVTISAPRAPTVPRVKVGNRPSRKERHLALMGVDKRRAKGKGNAESSTLSHHDLDTH